MKLPVLIRAVFESKYSETLSNLYSSLGSETRFETRTEHQMFRSSCF